MLFTLVVYRLVRLHGCYVNGAWVGSANPSSFDKLRMKECISQRSPSP